MQSIPPKIKKIAINAITRVPAYRTLLKQKRVTLRKVASDKDFRTLPITSKETFIYKHPITSFFDPAKYPQEVYASSGSSGKPSFWFRGGVQEKMGAEIHEIIFRDIFGITKKEKTLVIVTFSMGIWVAGNFTAQSVRMISDRGYNMTLATPGIEREDIFNVIKTIAPLYENVILCGYPPFLMDIVKEANIRGLGLEKKNVFGLTAGDKFTEEWRDTFTDLIGKKNKPEAVIGVYGSADAVVMGFETPLSIYARRMATKDKDLYAELFGEESILPNISQYHPDYIYFETLGEELLVTADTAIPLIRYNIHDRGDVRSAKEVLSTLKKYNLLTKTHEKQFSKWAVLPCVTVKGRTDVATTFYALNIYPEHIRAGIESRGVVSLLSGNFLVYTKGVTGPGSEQLHIDLEMAEGKKTNIRIKKRLTDSITKSLSALNIEFRKLHESLGKKALPTVHLVDYKARDWLHVQGKHALVNIKGKKPKMILN
jgi:phenylacetate-CoA ligase